MRTWIERLKVDQRFGGRGDNHLDRIKRMRDDGWDLTVLICYAPVPRGKLKSTGEVIVLGCRP